MEEQGEEIHCTELPPAFKAMRCGRAPEVEVTEDTSVTDKRLGCNLQYHTWQGDWRTLSDEIKSSHHVELGDGYTKIS